MAGRLVACDDEEEEVVAEVARIDRDAVGRLSVHEHRDEVCAVAALAAPGELVSVLEHLERRRRPERQIAVHLALGAAEKYVGVLRVGVADELVAPLDQTRDIGFGDIEQLGEHADREVCCNIGDEVEVALDECLVERGGGDAAQEGLVARERARGELRLQHPAQGAVPNAIGLEN